MRVTFVLPGANLSGGVRVVCIHAQRLRARGHDVGIVCPPPAEPSLRSRVGAALTGRGWPRSVRRPPSHMDSMGLDYRVLDRHRPVVAADVPDADVAVATWWETAHWVAALPREKGAKAFFIQHHEIYDGQPVERVRAAWRLPLHKITIAQWLVDLAADEYGDRDCTLVPNSVDTDLFHAAPRGRQPAPTVGLLYSHTPLKGCARSFEAIRIARERFPDLRVLAFGDRPPTDGLPLPAGTEFHLAPAQESIRDLYARCDVWLCGSDLEGFHLPPLEAMACRTPVVSTRVGGAVETVVPGRNGFLADVGDVQGLAAGLVQVLELSPEEWRRFSDAAWERAHAYTWDDAADRFLEGLRTAMRKDGRT